MDLLDYWPWWLSSVILTVLTVLASIHVIFYKRDARAAVAWIATLYIAPLVGILIYFIFGINRIQRRARRLRRRARRPKLPVQDGGDLPEPQLPTLPEDAAHLATLAELVETVTETPLLQNNAIESLFDGDQAYPAMLRAIDEAKESVGLLMYIFTHDDAGQQFVDALARAVERKVEVRVLVDDVGTHFLWRSIVKPLRAANVPTARFLPRWIPSTFMHANLRNHRKILVVDGRVAFTGGMNISAGHWHHLKPPHLTQDLHFRLEGPVVAHVQSTFVDDWKFTTGEALSGERWFPKLEPKGQTLARGVSSGPDEDLEKIRLVFLGALASARSSVRIITPYFLPDPGLVSALTIAALRGVQVDILVPKKNDPMLIQWAMMAQYPQVLEYGCRVWLTGPPFLHTKLMVVDGVWVMFGSANWDPRSLRLNFEFNVECYDRDLATMLEYAITKEIKNAERLTLEKWKRRSPLVKLRDGVAWLMSPLL